MWSMNYGTVPDRARFLEHCAKRELSSFPMELTSSAEWEALKSAVNQGIDSHLEGVYLASDARIVDRTTKSGRLICQAGHVVINDPGSLHTLIRRLIEIGETEEWDNADNLDEEVDFPPALELASSILSALDIEWV